MRVLLRLSEHPAPQASPPPAVSAHSPMGSCLPPCNSTSSAAPAFPSGLSLWQALLRRYRYHKSPPGGQGRAEPLPLTKHLPYAPPSALCTECLPSHCTDEETGLWGVLTCGTSERLDGRGWRGEASPLCPHVSEGRSGSHGASFPTFSFSQS